MRDDISFLVMMQRLACSLLGFANRLGVHIILIPLHNVLGSGDLRAASGAHYAVFPCIFVYFLCGSLPAHMLAGKVWMGGLLGWQHAAYRSALTGEVAASACGILEWNNIHSASHGGCASWHVYCVSR